MKWIHFELSIQNMNFSKKVHVLLGGRKPELFRKSSGFGWMEAGP